MRQCHADEYYSGSAVTSYRFVDTRCNIMPEYDVRRSPNGPQYKYIAIDAGLQLPYTVCMDLRLPVVLTDMHHMYSLNT